MSAHLKRGAVIWVLGFLTFLMGLGTLEALIAWEVNGQDFTMKPFLLGSIIGQMSAATYFWTSIGLTFFLLGLTAMVGFLRLPPHPHIIQGLLKLEEDIATNATMLEAAQVGLFQRLEQNQESIEGISKSVGDSLTNTEIEMQSILNKQRKSIRGFFSKLANLIEQDSTNTRTMTTSLMEKQSQKLKNIEDDLTLALKKSVGTKEILVDEMKKMSKIVRDAEHSTEQSVNSLQWRIKKIEERIAELSDIGERMERIETKLTTPIPSLTSQDESEKIRGMTPRLAEDLKVMGLISVRDFLTTDAATIAAKTSFPRDKINKLQANAQLLMVPGIEWLDAELLEDVGIDSRKELARQDPIELAKKVTVAAKAYVEQGKMLEIEQPTIEEVWSWVKSARI